jgi:plasmid stabilization system protein ParE
LARVDVTKPFRDDLFRQTTVLVRAEEWTRVDALALELGAISSRLVRFPEIGRELIADSRYTLRRIALGRSPYFVWYRFDRRTDVVRLTRLFHAHQRTPAPHL